MYGVNGASSSDLSIQVSDEVEDGVEDQLIGDVSEFGEIAAICFEIGFDAVNSKNRRIGRHTDM